VKGVGVGVTVVGLPHVSRNAAQRELDLSSNPFVVDTRARTNDRSK
jgi:hypothetical protein